MMMMMIVGRSANCRDQVWATCTCGRLTNTLLSLISIFIIVISIIIISILIIVISIIVIIIIIIMMPINCTCSRLTFNVILTNTPLTLVTDIAEEKFHFYDLFDQNDDDAFVELSRVAPSRERVISISEISAPTPYLLRPQGTPQLG